MTEDLERFRLHEVADGLYHFLWGEFADWYLELVKPRLWDDAQPESREAARATLVAVLDGICRLLHPLMPFVTSAIWDRLPTPSGGARPEALMVAPWPTPDPARRDDVAEAAMADLQELIVQVRSLRKEYNVPEGQRVPVVLTSAPEAFAATVENQREAIKRLARVEAVGIGAEGNAGAGAHAVLKNGAEVFVPLEGVIDVVKERGRLQTEIERLGEQAKGARSKLENQNFVSRAPDDVVARERAKADSFAEQMEKLEVKLRGLAEA